MDLQDKQGLVSAMIESVRVSLFKEVPDFARHLGYDDKAIRSHSTDRLAKGKEQTSDPDADWGKHETSGANAGIGQIWKKVKSWFGYGLHPQLTPPSNLWTRRVGNGYRHSINAALCCSNSFRIRTIVSLRKSLIWTATFSFSFPDSS